MLGISYVEPYQAASIAIMNKLNALIGFVDKTYAKNMLR